MIGVWSTTYRRKDAGVRARRHDQEHAGTWVQVSRLGMPLVNEVVIPLGQKDMFNASKPTGDAQFLPFVQDPEPARLIPHALPGREVPPHPGSDLVSIFLTGIPGAEQAGEREGRRDDPAEHVHPADRRRRGQDRLGLLAGQNDGFPNGRRLVDDVTDIELRALAGGTPFTADSTSRRTTR